MSSPASKHITVCVCTFRRPQLLERLLRELDRQQRDARFSFSIVVSDNDASRSSEPIVSAHAKKSPVSITYCSEPRQNIALARNQALAHATGDYIAFIDDDEFPAPDWLRRMLDTCEAFNVAGVLGPVRPHFDEPPPQWIINGRFCERPEYPTGRPMDWEESRTGNLLFRRSIVSGDPMPFKPEFGSGGEDKDFFMRMSQRGHSFCWCNEGVTYETVPPARWTRSYMLRRALLRGRNILKHPVGRARLVAQSLLAVPVYSVVLPVTLPFGQHVFMKYCIKFCDHAGRLLAVFGLNLISER
jgi:succinoglycan biosynthesis protein ExoM